MAIQALQAIRKLGGGSQCQLMLGSDENLWIVKFQNNPQHRRVLANEMFVSAVARRIGLPVPDDDIIEVSEGLIERTSGMKYELGLGMQAIYTSGRQFGSKYVGSDSHSVVDYLPERKLRDVTNLKDFAGILCIDKWMANCDGRQAVFLRKTNCTAYSAVFIDHGLCLNCGEWTFPDAPLLGRYHRSVYQGVTGWDSFDPWLTLLEQTQADDLWKAAKEIPPEWYGNVCDLERLIVKLLRRRAVIRELITSVRNSDSEPFPLWKRTPRAVVP